MPVSRQGWLPLGSLSLLAGALAFAASSLFHLPQRDLWGLGIEYGEMANAPFAGTGPFPHRILGPLLAHLLQLGGDRYWLFSHATMVVFLAVLFGAAIRRGGNLAGATVLVFALAQTTSVAIYKGVVGYPDALSFMLLVLARVHVEDPWRFRALLLLGLLNHEMTALFWPWLWWQRAQTPGFAVRRELVPLAAIALAYAAFHVTMHPGTADATEANWSIGFYLSHVTVGPKVLGMWILNGVSFVMAFGLLPTLLCCQVAVEGWRRAGMPIVLFLGGVLATSLVATDLWRFTGFLLVPVYFAGITVLQGLRHSTIVVLVLALLSIGAIHAQGDVVLRILDEMSHHYPYEVAAVWTHVLRDLWYVFAGYLLAYAAMAVAGTWLARRLGRTAHATT